VRLHTKFECWRSISWGELSALWPSEEFDRSFKLLHHRSIPVSTLRL
jgi:hypothetical protein